MGREKKRKKKIKCAVPPEGLEQVSCTIQRRDNGVMWQNVDLKKYELEDLVGENLKIKPSFQN